MSRFILCFFFLLASMFAQTEQPDQAPPQLPNPDVQLPSLPQLPEGFKMTRVNNMVVLTPPLKTLPPQMRLETIRVTRIEKKWAKSFHMEKWDVAVVILSHETLDKICEGRKCWAASLWDSDRGTGAIFILKRSEYTKEMRAFLRSKHTTLMEDQRDSVVHEMLHNVLRNMPTENAVVTITDAILHHRYSFEH